MSLARLPDFALDPCGKLGARVTSLGLRGYQAAARYIWTLPYGRNSDRTNFGLVLDEGRGTCSTKHALLAELAREHGRPVSLMLGIYEMNEDNTPGVGKALERYGLSCVPEAHCYLLHGATRLDLTHPSTFGLPVEKMLREERIEARQIGTYKMNVHRDFVKVWATRRGLGFDHVWEAREACIAALAQHDARRTWSPR